MARRPSWEREGKPPSSSCRYWCPGSAGSEAVPRCSSCPFSSSSNCEHILCQHLPSGLKGRPAAIPYYRSSLLPTPFKLQMLPVVRRFWKRRVTVCRKMASGGLPLFLSHALQWDNLTKLKKTCDDMTAGFLMRQRCEGHGHTREETSPSVFRSSFPRITVATAELL